MPFTSSSPLPDGCSADVVTQTGTATLQHRIETILLNVKKELED